MAIFVLVVPQVVAKGGGPSGADVRRPYFGSMTKEMDTRGWGQASDAWEKLGTQCVWVRCDATEAAAIAAEVGGTVLGETKAVDEAKGDTLTAVYREKVASAEAVVKAQVVTEEPVLTEVDGVTLEPIVKDGGAAVEGVG